MTFSECTVHCHTSLCDGQNTPAEMAAAAFAQGVKVLGFSGHSHTPHIVCRGKTPPVTGRRSGRCRRNMPDA